MLSGPITIISGEEQLANDFNDTIVPYAKQKTLFAPFEEQVALSPDAIALRLGDDSLTFDEVNRAANKVAHFLIQHGVVPGSNVGLLVSRSFNMIIGMLGILKAGGAYVPIDPEYPVDRQEYIFQQSALTMVIANGNYSLKEIIGGEKFWNISEPWLEDFPDHNPGLIINSSQLAYTIYTSGSTGRPKGVMIEHHSAINLISWVNKRFNVGPDDTLLFITSMCFDLSVYDIFGMLAAGGCIVIAETADIQDVRSLADMLTTYNVTFWDSVPTTLDYLVRNLEQERKGYRCNSLKTVFMSGDWIPVSLPGRLKKFFPQTQVVSLGGATEATVWSNFFIVDEVDSKWKSIPYGRPIDNNFFYILDEDLKPVANGEVGDLYIGGVGVARGYANDPGKTEAAFMTDPFNQDMGGRMYRTGDLGRMMPDHNMEFLGRKDNQVKINGFRVELGEIESVLNSSEEVYNAIVLARDSASGGKRLAAYVVPKGKFDKESLESFLKTKLPEYMVPSIWMQLESMPLNSNGKIDRNALPAPNDISGEKRNYLAPESETERILAAIWKDCMAITEFGVDDNFFALGGHSLMAVQILSKIEKQIGKKMPLALFFKYPNIKSLAAFIDHENQEIVFKSLVAIKPSGSKPPLYIIHGEGLNVLNFSGLAEHMDEERPIFGLQARALNGKDAIEDSIQEIAAFYLSEILLHNPDGPYLIAGYSFGGYVAVEIEKQMQALGKKIQMLIMLDTDAEKTEYKDWYYLFPRKVKRNFPIFISFLKATLTRPITTIKKQLESNAITKYLHRRNSKAFFQMIKKIKERHLMAFRNYRMEPFNNKVYLFKAKICVHYVDDAVYLGWKHFAKEGVELYEVPGDHLSMLVSPNVEYLAQILEKTLDQHDSYVLKTNYRFI